MRNGIKGFILRGLAAGAAGGAAAALFIRFVTERQISAALKYENATGIGLPPGEPAEFSRGTQHWGGMAAAVIYGLALGVVFGIALAALHHRIRGRNEFDRASRLALAAFVAVVLIPALKYPPNPPTVGNPDTINQRTTDYLLLLAASVVVVAITFWFWTWLTGRGWDGASRFLVGGGALVVMVTVLMLVWPPSPDAITPPDSDAAPALQISSDAPPDVLAAMLDAARANGDGWIRDPQHPDQPLDLSNAVPEDLVGAPAAVSTTRLMTGSYTTILWHFRILVIAGLALMWAVIAGVFGLLADLPSRARASRPEDAPTGSLASS